MEFDTYLTGFYSNSFLSYTHEMSSFAANIYLYITNAHTYSTYTVFEQSCQVENRSAYIIEWKG